MIKQLVAFFTSIVVSTTVLAQACQFSGATQIPLGSTWDVGPSVFAAASANPLVVTAVFTGQNAWDASDAIDRFTGYSGTTSGSDCPFAQGRQLGAYGFAGTTCTTNLAYPDVGNNTLAFVDYFPGNCIGCGTKSMSVNLNFVWSVSGTPLTGEYHLADIVAHEFGHMLGLAHQSGGICGSTAAVNSCAATPARETMQYMLWPGSTETCNSTIETSDINAANSLY